MIRAARNLTLYKIRNWFGWARYIPGSRTSLPDFVKRMTLREGTTFTDDAQSYTFYHNGYWEAHGGYDKNSLPNTHQAWVMEVTALAAFMEDVQSLLHRDSEYADKVQGNIILENVTPIPPNKTAMSPEKKLPISEEAALSVVYQITVAVDSKEGEIGRAAIRFYRELSEKVKRYANVHILKESHADNCLLQAQYKKGISRVNRFLEKYDRHRILSSALWERLTE